MSSTSVAEAVIAVRTTLYWLRTLSFAILIASGGPFILPAAADSDLQVNVQIVDGEIRADVSLFVKAPRRRVWDVITDFERAPEFMRDLQISKVIARTGDTLRVLQKDLIRFGPFQFAVDTVKDVRLVEPLRTESRLVSGSLRKYEARTELVPEAGGTRILYRSEAIPGSALAIFAGEGLVRRETEERFKQLRQEILRREHVAATDKRS
jgi:carbon monoxide dehydrogenase subunit G